MLLEKYVKAAQEIVAQAMPLSSRVVAEQSITGLELSGGHQSAKGALVLSYYEPAAVSNRFEIEHAGRYKLVLNMSANERYVDNEFDYNRCRFTFSVDGSQLFTNDFNREGGRALHYEFDQQLAAGIHEMRLSVTPLAPAREQVRALALRINSVTL